MATVSCPHCSQLLEVPEDNSGQNVRCPRCRQTFAPASSSVASGEPPARPSSTETGVTENAPAANPSAPDSDYPIPRERRDVAKKSSPVVPIVVVGAVVLFGLCLCGVPVVSFLSGFGMFHLQRQEREVALRARDEQADAAAQVGKAKAPMIVGFAKGGADAKDAIAKGTLLLKEYPPLPAPAWHGEYIKLLKEKCKCDYQVIAAPNLPKDQEDEIRGWNETMTVELGRRHGKAILAELQGEAEKRWRDRGLKAKENK